MRRLLLILALCSPCFGQLWSGILDPARAIDWSTAGTTVVDRQTQSGSTIAACTDVSSSIHACTDSINSALASAANNTYVLLGAGTFNLKARVLIGRSNVTLRGAGANQTFLIWTASGSCNGPQSDICVYSGDGNWWGAPNNGPVNWTATSYAKGQTTITLASRPNLKVGSLIVLWQDDDAVGTAGYYVCSVQGSSGCSDQPSSESAYAGHGQSQIVEITSCGTSTFGATCSSSTVTFTPGLYAPNWASGKNPKAWWGTNLPITGVGIENLSLDHRAITTGGILLFGTNRSWVKNVRSLSTGYAHIQLLISSHDTIRDSYFYGGSGSSQGYGVNSSDSSCDNLIENNISQHLANFAVTEGDCGSVFSYNYAVDNFFGPGNWQQNDATHHSVGDHYELYEGFDGIGSMADAIHGTSNAITTFRNRFSGLDPATANGTKTQATIPQMMLYGSRFHNSIGNVLGTSGYHNVYQNVPPNTTDCGGSQRAIFSLGYSDQNGAVTFSCAGATGPGNDMEVVNDVMRWGNYSVVTQSSDTPTNSGIRFVSSEVPSGNAYFPNAVPSSTTLPSSFYLSAKPSWWLFPLGNPNTPWPAVGPDITGGNIANVDGHAYHNPAANCYLNVMGGLTDGTSGALTFDAALCYAFIPPAPAFGIRGNVALRGVSFGPSVASRPPLTYSARTDQCELGTESVAVCPTQTALSFLGCNTWANGTYTSVNSTPACPVTNGGTAPNMGGLGGVNTVITEPDFGSKVVRVTDYTHTKTVCGSGAGYLIGSSATFNIWSADSKKFIITPANGTPCLFAFDPVAFAAGTGTISAPSQIHGPNGDPTCLTNCTRFISDVIFSQREPNTMFEFDQNNVRLYRLVITNPTADPSTWVFDRTLIFDFLTGCGGGRCGLPADFNPTWSGTFSASDDDTSFTMSLSDDGQLAPKNPDGTTQNTCPLTFGSLTGSARYGPIFAVNVSIGKGTAGPAGNVGWRVYETCGIAGVNGGLPYITGNFGDSGTPTTGVGMAYGVSGGGTESDAGYLHEAGSLPDARFGAVAFPAGNLGPGSCSNGHPCASLNAWEVATTNMRPCVASQCAGHNAKGFVNHYDGTRATAHSYHDPTQPPGNQKLNPDFTWPNDQHGTYNQVGSLDLEPPMFGVSAVCDVDGVPGHAPTGNVCEAYALSSWWNEMVAIENSVANPAAKHCNYGGGPTACVYRFGTSYNTGTNSNFGIQNSIMNVNQHGTYALFSSDWNRTLGCSNGWDGVSAGQLCMDPVTANNAAVWGGTSSATDKANYVSVDGSDNTTITFDTLPADTSLWSPGMYVDLSNFAESWVNSSNLLITSVGTGCHGGGANCFTGTGIATGHSGYAAAETAGKATWSPANATLINRATSRGDVFVIDLTSAH